MKMSSKAASSLDRGRVPAISAFGADELLSASICLVALAQTDNVTLQGACSTPPAFEYIHGVYTRLFSNQTTMMERLKRLVKAQQPPEADYEPIPNDGLHGSDASEEEQEVKTPFSWVEYSVFFLLGVAMLWAWWAPRISSLR